MFENSFSTRNGYTPPPALGQRGELSKDARIHLWKIFHTDFVRHHYRTLHGLNEYSHPSRAFFMAIWTDLFFRRIDLYPGDNELIYNVIGGQLEGADWHLMLDIWEGVFQRAPQLLPSPENTAQSINNALNRENTTYSFVGGVFVDKMTDAESESVETALISPLEGIREHFKTLSLNADNH
jgi:AbiJ N-terminal domain 4